jgi:hypothetical protein
MVTDFNPFLGERSLMLVASRRSTPARRRFVLSLPLIILGGLTLGAAVRDDAAGAHLIQGINDAASLLFAGKPPAQLVTADLPSKEALTFPVTRDLMSLVAITILAGTPFLIYRMWSGYAQMLSSMMSQKALRVHSGDRARLNRSIARCNSDVRLIGLAGPFTFVALWFVVLILRRIQREDGMFTLLAPGGEPDWSQFAFAHWWAGHGLGAFLYEFALVYGVYLITQQNLVGFRIIFALARARRLVRFEANPLDTDGYFGWAQVRKSLAAVYIELAVHGVALAAAFSTFPSSVIRGPAAVAWLQWVIVLPLYLAFPFVLVRPTIRAFKEHEISALEADYTAQLNSKKGRKMRATEVAVLEDQISTRIARLRSIPTLPFHPRDSALFLMAALADAAAVLALLSRFFTT